MHKKRPAPRGGRYLLPLASALVTTGLVAQTAPAADPAASDTSDEDVVVLSPFEVTAANDTGYTATDTLAGTRIRTDLRDVGSAITVLTKDFLNDIGATDNTTLLQYTPNAEVAGTRSTYTGLGNGTSVNEQSTLASPSSANRVRGLSAADNTRDFFVSDIPWDGYNIDRVDIQRGPNSILFGLGKPAGIINASLQSAAFKDSAAAEFRFGSYGSTRSSLNVNQVLINDVLAVRVAGLLDREKFRQDPAFEDDERIYAALRWDPKIFAGIDGRTSFKAKIENGSIDANRPRTVTPNDHITAWFRDTDDALGGLGKLTLSNGYNAEYESTPVVGGDGKGITRSADPDYNAWVTARGNQQTPFYFYDGSTGQLYQLYGGYVNKGAVASNGTALSASTSLPGLRYSGIFYGVNGLASYASSAKLAGYQYGQYREQSLTDSSIFDFYNKLIDGPNKSEKEDWDTINLSFSQTAWDNRVGVEVNFDRQKYKRVMKSLFGYSPSIDIDILESFQDLSENENLGRAYIQGTASGSSYESERNVLRTSAFAELRTSDLTSNKFLQRLFGKQRFNGVYSAEKYEFENLGWLQYGTSADWDDYLGVSLGFTDRPPVVTVYLGDSLLDATTASGANLPNVASRIAVNSGPIYTFSSQWVGGTIYGDTWTVPDSLADVYNTTSQLYQNSNPENYVGWNSDYNLEILNYDEGDTELTTRASKTRRKIRSFAGTWQSFLWDGALVGTMGWRYDTVRDRSVSAKAVSSNRGYLDMDPDVYTYGESSVVKDHSLSWGGVFHLNKILKKDPLPINVSLSYNTSSNFEVGGTRYDLYGNQIGNPSGDTKDYGILLATKDGKYSFRVMKYESTVKDAATDMSSLNMFGDIIALGLRWRNVFLYNLNAYTLATANGSNEWRYNFDPDTSIGETQAEATARENASIAAWNEIQDHLPDSFYSFWGWSSSPPADLSNPTDAEVYAYPVRWSGSPTGFTLTSDTTSKGYEFEFTANPLRNWRITINAAKTEAVRTNVGGSTTIDFINYMSEMLAGPAGEMRMYSGGPTAWTLLQQWNSWVGAWTLLSLQEGAASPEVRKWRYNIVTNYTFSSGFLKNVGVGGSYRWQDKVVIGYPVVAVDSTTFSFDLTQPYYGPSEDAVDVWCSYERKLTDKINWKIQLNIRNLFADDDLIPVSVQPDGKTWATVRVPPSREWMITNTFSF